MPYKIYRNLNDLLKIGIEDKKKTKERKDYEEVYFLIKKIVLKTVIFYLKYGKIKKSYMKLT